ncbi:hypothetical protein [Tautonia plasticadhaerens]|uniref:PEP-CTERM protein-sorting domain-containing protein n=1 Tax=Tautonia plasticadhaerens TaxID=2527974 RepID=A0A518GV68_9BACT|nr:hypothetical protein [Tautonia plasticadhaerens]QDV32482.1 hypothetical protein ElP_03150 [Tautonia plasticadhaerens]
MPRTAPIGHRSPALALAGVVALSLAASPASASAIRYELLPASARPYHDRSLNARGQWLEVDAYAVWEPEAPTSHARSYLMSRDLLIEGRDEGRRDLGVLYGGSTVALALNDRGEVVGHASGSGDGMAQRGFLWRDGAMIDLAPGHPELHMAATAINNRGQVAGQISAFGPEGPYSGQIFLFDDERGFRPIESIGIGHSSAKAINDDGVVVGQSDWKAVVVLDETVLDLNLLTGGLGEWSLTDAWDVTEDGWIYAFGEIRRPIEQGGGLIDSGPHWLRPVATPEPASVVAWLGLAGLVSGWRALGRRRASSGVRGRRP